MSTTCIAPDEEVANLLEVLFGLDVDAKESKDKVKLEDGCVAVYGDDDNPVKAAFTCELAFANSAGAALAMIPPAFAKENNDAGSLPDNLRENFSEVMNLCANVFPKQRSVGFSLREVFGPGEVPADHPLHAVMESAGDMRSLDVTVGKYGASLITLVSCGE